MLLLLLCRCSQAYRLWVCETGPTESPRSQACTVFTSGHWLWARQPLLLILPWVRITQSIIHSLTHLLFPSQNQAVIAKKFWTMPLRCWRRNTILPTPLSRWRTTEQTWLTAGAAATLPRRGEKVSKNCWRETLQVILMFKNLRHYRILSVISDQNHRTL